MASGLSTSAVELSMSIPSPIRPQARPDPFSYLTEKGTIDCISDDALIHLRSYKYSSVDKSPVSKYILGPWVRHSTTARRGRELG